MAVTIRIKKGLDIGIKGRAPQSLLTAKKSDRYGVVPEAYVGLYPKVTVKAGEAVKAGTAVLIDKNRPEIRVVSPVSGRVVAVNRGEKRKLLSIEIAPDKEIAYEDFGIKKISALSVAEVKEALLKGGLWPYLRQRPYDIIASPEDTPRDIFVCAFYSAPLAADFDFILRGQAEDFQTGIDALCKLTGGKVYVGVRPHSGVDPQGAEKIEVSGPHPAGNAGVLINHIQAVNKGEKVWVTGAEEVILIGRLFNKGKADFTRLVAITGSEARERGYVKAISGCRISSLTEGRIPPDGYLNGFQRLKNLRIISGNVLTGTRVREADYLRPYDNQITVIPEGDDVHELFGWALPGLEKFSVSRTFINRLWGKGKEYVIDARLQGGRRAMIMSNEYDKVFPLDIYPEYLLKAILAFDIDKMEQLGIYEVAPEDFALCEFVDTSKIEIQHIVRQGLDALYKEMN
ncbi:MAG: Na(+)-translocating NADH-quinone reductase subunit A [Tannerellaceae bacterium]|jgi:Na+-transporting NADH:ubiquinone oxidoreductase subunit A|nr:Na(+)-translocating NADH-quinone reductase subunit A [Tannerellaceae bacterium]